jgi:hypothetical protein
MSDEIGAMLLLWSAGAPFVQVCPDCGSRTYMVSFRLQPTAGHRTGDPSLLVVPLLVKATKMAAAEQWQEQRNHELYQANFGTQVPVEAMRILRAADLVSLIQDSIAINIPMAETGWTLPMEFSPRGCCIMDRATPSKGPDGEWLH